MGLTSALTTALTGMTASESTIDVVGNNLANSNTVAFKQSSVSFATQFLQTRSLGSAPTTDSGGSNPRQIGLGVLVASIAQDFSQGTIEVSSTDTDMAIQGEGFYIVQGSSGETLYTRNGEFSTNALNELVTLTGNRVMGYGVDTNYAIDTTKLVPISIPLGQAKVAEATKNVYLEGTLTPTGNLATSASIVETGILSDNSYTYPLTAATGESSGSPVTTTTTATAAAGGTLAGGTYYYKYVFATGNPPATTALPLTEGAASAASPVGGVLVDGVVNQTVNLANIPQIATGSGFTQINIYRTSGDPVTGTYTYVDNVAAGTTVFTDDGTAPVGVTLNAASIGNQEQVSYYVCYYNSDGTTSRPSPITSGITVAANGRVLLSNLPTTGGTTGWQYIKIYRNAPTTTAGSDRWFEVNTFANDTGTVKYIDASTDSSLYTSETVHSPEIDLDGPKITQFSLLTNVISRSGSTYSSVFSPGVLSFTGTKGGKQLSAKTFTITATSTVGDLLQFMSDALGTVQRTSTNGIPASIDTVKNTEPPTYVDPGWQVTSTGRMMLVSNNGTKNDIKIGISDLKLTNTSGISTISMPFTTYQDGVGESAVTDCVVYDSLGISCDLRLTFVLESRTSTSTTYRWFADSSSNELSTNTAKTDVGTGTISFDGEGNYLTASSKSVAIYRDNVASTSPLIFDLDFSNISGLAATTSSVNVSSQDGSAPGTLTSFIVGEDGVISGVFSNGITRNLGQIRLARFANPSGLEQLGQNLYRAGVNSGLPIFGNPGENGIGTIQGGALELSNTDIGGNLIDLILASTMYRSNAKVISTTQQMLDELLTLGR